MHWLQVAALQYSVLYSEASEIMLFGDHEAKAESLRLGFLAVQKYTNGKEVIDAHLDNAVQSQCTQTTLRISAPIVQG